LVDDLYVYIAPIIIGGKITPTMADGLGIKGEDELICLKIVSIKNLGVGILVHYKRL
jgi:riboflavin biosynthesis pyrimidine reductase